MFVDVISGYALGILLKYLAGSSASVLDNTMVEKEQLASGIYYSTDFRPHAVTTFSLSSVATEKLEQVEARFFEVLKETAAKTLDMEYLKDCISRERRQVKFQAEDSGQFFTDSIIKDFLFGNRSGTTLRADLENMEEYDTLESWTDKEWRARLREWLSEAHHVTILGKPSAEMSERLKSEEKTRVEERKKELGKEGLEKLAKKLDNAKAENDREIPKGVLEKFPVPSTKSIHFIETTTARSGAARKMGSLENHIQEIIDREKSELPLFIHYEHIRSNFAYITILIGTESVPVHLRPLLSIYVENFFAAPMLRDGKKIEFEQIIMELERDTVGYSMQSGQRLGNSETLSVQLQVEVEKYKAAIQWIRDLMFSSIFDLERIKTTVSRLLAEIPDEKRDGSDMANSVDEMLITTQAAISRARGTLVRAVYLKRVKHLLEREPETIIDQLKEINRAVCQPISNLRVLVMANIEKLKEPVSAWTILTDGSDLSKSLLPLESRVSRLNELGRQPGDAAYIVPMPTIDSSFCLVDAKGPSSYDDPDLPALMTAASYLNAVEGPLWTAVRGTGLAYGTSLRTHIASGQISLDIFRSPDSYKAFVASKAVIEDHISGKTPFDPLALEGAISSIVLSLANGEATMASAAQSSFIRQVVRGQSKDYPQIILEKVRKVTVDQIKDVMTRTVLPLVCS